MNNRAKSSGTNVGGTFKKRDRVRPLLPSDIQGAWRDAGKWFPPAIGASLQFLDPVFHPAEASELEAWVDGVVGDIASKQTENKSDIKSGGATTRDFRDCDDSAFSLKSAASAYRQSPLAAPLCAGIVGCHTKLGPDQKLGLEHKLGRAHVLNWFVSVEITKPGKYPEVEFKLWFTDVTALVEASVLGWDRKSLPPKGPVPKLLEILASAEDVSKYFEEPYLILV